MAERDDLPEPAGAGIEESAEELWEDAPCGYLSTRPDGTITRANRTFLRWTGYRSDELVGRRRFVELLTAGGRIYHETHYAPLLRMQGTLREIALEIVCADGRRLPVLVNSVLRQDEAGRPLAVRTTVFDATDRRRYEQELLRARRAAEAADRAKADFISMVSHEVRTPVQAVMGVAHLLESTDVTPRQERLVRMLRNSAENLLALVNDILDFGRIEAGGLDVERRPLDLRELLDGVAQGLAPKVAEKALRLTVTVDERIPEVLLGDPVKLRQIVTNLAGNAVKFTAEGEVEVAAELEAAAAEPAAGTVAIELRVTDTGIGIAPERLEHVFDDYTQASYDIGLKYGGSGLGLAITRKLTELLGGTVGVASEVGRGSTFTVRLGLAVPPGPLPAEPTAAPGGRDELRGLRVLVVDDNEVTRYVLGDLLRGWGIEVDGARDGGEAVAKVQQQGYDLVLMDLHMPELDGRSACRALRELPDPRFRELPIVATSASARIGHEHEIEGAGFTDFVGKPVNPDVLYATIARLTVREAS